MKRFLYILMALAVVCGTGCGSKGGGDAFELTVDSLTVEGTVSDNLERNPTVKIDDNPATVSSGTFIGNTSTTGKDSFKIEAADKVPNRTSKTVKIR